MATQTDHIAAAMPTTASLVGNTFVNKYYNFLHQSPQVVHRFYTDQSILSRAEAGPNGSIDIVVSQAGIDHKIMSLDYRDFRAEIKTVDSLESLNGSVLVMVTGALSSQSRPKRNFVQTFFLAPQNVGYFVLNDMFRYLDSEPIPIQYMAVPMPNGTMDHTIQVPNPGPVLVDPQLPRMESKEYVMPSLNPPPTRVPIPTQIPEVPLPQVHYQAQEVKAAHKAEEESHRIEDGKKKDEKRNKIVNNSSHAVDKAVGKASHKENQVPDTEEHNVEETPKKSYASILRLQRDASGVLNGVANNSVASPALEENVTVPQTAATNNSQSNGLVDNIEKPAESTIATDEPEVDGLSVYVKNLPLKITTSELEEEFNKFGAIKPGGINLRNQRIGICFAFIEFEETSSAQKAIQASPILIEGRKVYVEEKKTMAQRSSGRGRFNHGRGYSYDVPRGRGYFGGRRTHAQDSARTSGQDSSRMTGQDSTRADGKDSERTNGQDSARINVRDSARVDERDSTRIDRRDSSRTNGRDSERNNNNGRGHSGGGSSRGSYNGNFNNNTNNGYDRVDGHSNHSHGWSTRRAAGSSTQQA